MMRRPTYARTLKIIANAGNGDPVYGGKLGQQMVNDINAHGGQFLMDDLKNYKVRFRDTIVQSFGKGKLITTPPPTSGPVLSLILNILKGGPYFWICLARQLEVRAKKYQHVASVGSR